MVSQVEPPHSLALKGPSSVVSRSSRHRRHGRSHAGGSSFVPQNEFPVFSHTGDVEILVKAGSQTNRYLLHKIILAQCSGFFEASTSQEWSRPEPVVHGGQQLSLIGEESGSESSRTMTMAKKEVKRWRYELDPGAGEDDIPMLVQKEDTQTSLFGSNDARPPPVRNKPPTSNPSFFRSVASLSLSGPTHVPSSTPLSQDELDLLNDYDNLFKVFYNYPPALDPIDIATAYIQCKSLLTLADLYDALAVVGPRIDHHLLQFQSRLWKQVAKYPTSYLKLGHMSQSKSIFQEALIHVVGAWPVGERHIRNQLPDNVLEIIEDKVEDLEEMVGRIEGRLFRLTLTTSRGDRVTPHNSYLDWLVVSLFRQWLADSTSPPPPTPAARASQSRNGGHHSRNNHVSIPVNATHHTNTTVQQFTPQSAPAPQMSRNPNVGRTFKIIGSSSSLFLNHDECKKFLKLTPDVYSRESLKKFEKRLDDLKAMAREIVKPLMKSQLLGEGAANAAYLVCTRVSDRDIPWSEN